MLRKWNLLATIIVAVSAITILSISAEEPGPPSIPQPEPAPVPKQIPKPDPIAESEVDKLKKQITDLNFEINELKKKIDELNEEIKNLNQIIIEQIKVIYKWIISR
jgi:TolA-binding protein